MTPNTPADVASLPLTADRLRQLVHYDPITGKFTWQVNRTGGVKAGDEVGAPGPYGYLRASIDGKSHKLHRLAWLSVHGEFPAGQVDHVNGDRKDNRIENLRVCSQLENSQNRMRGWGRSSLIGVDVDRRTGRWRARIKKDGKSVTLGLFDTPEEAHDAYLRAKAEIHPFWVKGDCNVAPID